MRAVQTSLLLLLATAMTPILGAGEARALTPIYGGGDPLAAAALDAFGQCLGSQNSANPNLAAATAAGCVAAATPAYDYLNDAGGSADALAALIAQTAPSTAAASGTTPTDSNFPAYPYPSWQLAVSNIPIDSPAPGTGAAYYVNGYNTALAAKRGRAWQIPMGAEAIAFPYNLPTTAFTAGGASYSGAVFGTGFYPGLTATASVTTPAGGSADVTRLDLSPDMLCYIWTGHRANGAGVNGTYTWDNPIFAGLRVTRAGKIHQTNYDSNLLAASVAGLAIQPVTVANSGLTYVLTLWLRQNCAGYATAGYTPPAATASFPSFVTAAGLSASDPATAVAMVAAHPGAIGYATPDVVAPVSPAAPPAAFLLAGRQKTANPPSLFVYPSPEAIAPALATLALPHNLAATSWGARLDRLLFKQESKGLGYPVVGLDYVLGYTCYLNDSAHDELTGVTAVVNFLGDAKAAAIVASLGLVPLTAAQYTGEAGLAAANLTGVSATPSLVGGTIVGGSTKCPAFASDPADYQ